MNARRYRLLRELLTQPTAPFRESHVVSAVTKILSRASVPFFSDPIGNLVVGVGSHAEYKRLVKTNTQEPLRLFIAHMDHPGFHGTRWLSKTRLRVKWHGGSPVKYLIGSRVWLATEHGYVGKGKFTAVKLQQSARSIDTATVRVETDLETGRLAAGELFGGFHFRAPLWRSGMRLYTKAADDLIGVFAIVSLACELFATRRKRRLPFLGLLTRAEEVGFIGAIGHFELGWLSMARRPVLCVSLESSRTLPNAEIGKGPVVRLGDRRTVFDPDAIKVLADLAQKVLPGKHQRRIMDGGTCEGTAATVYGHTAIGICIALGNYHNQGLEDGADCRASQGPAPEFVHVDDINGLLKLCRALVESRLPWLRPWVTQHQLFKKKFRRYKKLLGARH